MYGAAPPVSKRIVQDAALHERYRDRPNAVLALQSDQARHNAAGGAKGSRQYHNALSESVVAAAEGRTGALFDLKSRRAHTSMPWYGHSAGTHDEPAGAAAEWGLEFHQNNAAYAGLRSTAERGKVRVGFGRHGAIGENDGGSGWDYVDRPDDDGLTHTERRYADEYPDRWAKAIGQGADLPALTAKSKEVAQCRACSSASDAVDAQVTRLGPKKDKCPSSEAGGCARDYVHPTAATVSAVGSLARACPTSRSLLVGQAYSRALEPAGSLRDAGNEPGRLRADVQRIYESASGRAERMHEGPATGAAAARAGAKGKPAAAAADASVGGGGKAWSGQPADGSQVSAWKSKAARERFVSVVAEFGAPDGVQNRAGGEATWTNRAFYSRLSLLDVADADTALAATVRGVTLPPVGAAELVELRVPVTYDASSHELTARGASMADIVPLLLVAIDLALDDELSVEQARRVFPQMRHDARDSFLYLQMARALEENVREAQASLDSAEAGRPTGVRTWAYDVYAQ